MENITKTKKHPNNFSESGLRGRFLLIIITLSKVKINDFDADLEYNLIAFPLVLKTSFY